MPFTARSSFSAVLALASACTAVGHAQFTQHYTQTDLTSNTSGANVDSNLVNPWGLSRSSTGAWWTSDNGTGLSTLYNGAGATQALVVTIPSAVSGKPGSPTGTIFNATTGFDVAPGKPAAFLFATEDGTISGWNPAVNPKAALITVNTNQASVFKGLTAATVNEFGGPANFLYAADFRKGRIQVYDTNFRHVAKMEERFDDDQMPRGFAPFNIQNIGGNLYVAYAAQGGGKHDEVDGAGLGYVDVFSPTGKLLVRFDHGNYLNAPWGLVQAPGDFGAFSHDILVGNFGSGEIDAFNATTGHFDGKLMNAANTPIVIDGLWGLSVGNGTGAGSAIAVYFAAGLKGESGGLLGTLTAVENTQGNDQ